MITDSKIYFSKGYKYQIEKSFKINLNKFQKGKEKRFNTITLDSDWIKIEKGFLFIKKGFASDGASGPTRDTIDSFRAAFVHDALYKLMRIGFIPLEYKKEADKIFYRLLRKDGMNWFRANKWYLGVKFGGKSSTLPKNKKEVIVAPK